MDLSSPSLSSAESAGVVLEVRVQGRCHYATAVKVVRSCPSAFPESPLIFASRARGYEIPRLVLEPPGSIGARQIRLTTET